MPNTALFLLICMALAPVVASQCLRQHPLLVKLATKFYSSVISTRPMRPDKRPRSGRNPVGGFALSFARGLIMLTNTGAISTRERKAQAQPQTDTTIITIVLVWFIICLVMFVLLFADQSFSKAAIELMCLF
jgi:hypothetical protein